MKTPPMGPSTPRLAPGARRRDSRTSSWETRELGGNGAPPWAGRRGRAPPAQGLDVTTEFVLDDTSTSGRVTVLVVTWRACDPLAVSLSLVSRPDHPALPQGHWVAPRDALRSGLEKPTGDGDVRIIPDPRSAEVTFDLTDGARHSTVVLDAEPLRAFLARTEEVVPAGQEHPEQELDAVLDELLRA